MFKVCFVFVTLLVIFVAPASAAMTITEVHPQPTSGQEWIEIYNDSPQTFSISEWWLEDQLTTPSRIFQFTNDHLIPAYSFLTVEVSNQLNNGGDGVTLKNADGTVIDTMTYHSSTLGMSWSKIGSLFVLAQPSRGQTNPEPSPSPLPSPSPSASPVTSPTPVPTPPPAFDPYDILLSEIMACPSDGQPEWIELYNPTTSPMVLEQWRVTDWAGNSRVFDVVLTPNDYTAVPWLSSMLNNSGDSLFLENSLGDRIASASFSNCLTNQSFVWADAQWQLSTTPTQNQHNLLTTFASPLPSSLPSPTPILKPSPRPSPSASPTPISRDVSLVLSTSNSAQKNSPADLVLGQSHSAASPPLYRLSSLASSRQATAANQSEFLAVRPSKVTFWSAFSVILGGVLIAFSSLYQLYDYYELTLAQSLA